MRNSLLIILLLVTLQSNCQAIYPVETYFEHIDENNIYFKDVNHTFDKFLGLWEYSSTTEYFKIQFIKSVNTKEASGYTTINRWWDAVVSNFQYKIKINNSWVEVYNTFPAQQATPTVDYISGSVPESALVMKLEYTEPSSTGNCNRNKFASVRLIYYQNASNTPQLTWSRINWDNHGIDLTEPCPDGTPRDASEFKIPANMILTKVN